jgi:hypothetical protein
MATTTLPPPNARHAYGPSRRRRVRSSTPRSCAPRSPARSESSTPRTLMKNPVMFIVEVGALVTTGARDPRLE